MRNATKIATCCYCGLRSVLKLTARDGHELACGSCGAPLHEMKWLKRPEPKAPKRTPSPITALPKKTRKRRKPRWKELVEDIWDEIEDIFD